MFIGSLTLYAVNNIHSFYHLAKYGVGTIEMRRTSYLAVKTRHFIGHRCATAVECVETFTLSLKFSLRLFPSPHDIKLRTTGGLGGIALVGFSGGGYHSSFVKELGQTKLGRQRITCVGLSTDLSFLGITTVISSSLNHKVSDNAMKKGAIVIAVADKFDKVITVDGGLIEKGNTDVA